CRCARGSGGRSNVVSAAAQQAPEPLIGRSRTARLSAAQRGLRPLAHFSLVLALVWLVLFGMYTSFPYVRSGGDLIYDAKVKQLSRGVNADLVIFGNSKVLSGFVPALFDGTCNVRSYNLGLPDEQRF